MDVFESGASRQSEMRSSLSFIGGANMLNGELLISTHNRMAVIFTGLKLFAFTALVLQIFVALVFGFALGFSSSYSGVNQGTVIANDFINYLSIVSVLILVLIGFGLLASYMQKSSLMNMILIFIALTFTLQFYFVCVSFWDSVALYDGQYGTLGLRYNELAISHTTAFDRLVGGHGQTTITDSLACVLSIVVSLFALFGRIGPAETLFLAFGGTFAYTFLEGIFIRLSILDNGYAMRIFLFGSVNGVVTSLIIGKRDLNKNNSRYTSNKLAMFQGLLGSVFILILLPWLSILEKPNANNSFRDISFLNSWYAVTSSCMSAFAFSVLYNGGKINLHQIAFSAFGGAIAYGSSSDIMANPFPAMLIGFISALFTVLFNHYRGGHAYNGVWDSLGAISTFFIPAFIGSIYSAILIAIGAQNNNTTINTVQPAIYTNLQAGAYQLVGLSLAFATGAVAGVFIGLLNKIVNGNQLSNQFFNTHTYLAVDQRKLQERAVFA